VNVALIAVQLEIDATVLASGDAYRAHLVDMVGCAVEEAGEADARVIVLPEIAGHLALLALAPPKAHAAKSLGSALAASAVRRPLDVLRGVASTRTLDPKHAVLGALAPDGEKFWRSVFGPLARKHQAWIVAGSHLRLAPNGDLTNASYTFAPDGRCVATTDKINLVPGMEDGAPKGLGLARGDIEKLPVIEAPFGTLATLICYDGFSCAHTTLERFTPVGERLKARGGVTVAANPAANPWKWEGPWPPVSSASFAGPASTHPTRAEQWRIEGLPGTLAAVGFARWGITAHLVGKVLDLRFEGCSEILEGRGHETTVLARATQCDRGGHVTAIVRAKEG
jgi:predicted amidohydrolase